MPKDVKRETKKHKPIDTKTPVLLINGFNNYDDPHILVLSAPM